MNEKISKENIVNDFLKKLIKIDSMKNGITKYIKIIKILDKINEILPPQKSEGWFKERSKRITASVVSQALENNTYKDQTSFDLMKEKILGKIFQDNKYVHHGKKFEDIVQLIYSHIYDVKVKEYGLLPHRKYNFMGASPDGICQNKAFNGKRRKNGDPKNMAGTMLEIKCPFTRKIHLKGIETSKNKYDNPICPYYYWEQTQYQMEICDLDTCHFFQCQIEEMTKEEFEKKYPKTICKYGQNQDLPIKKEWTKGCITQFLPKDEYLKNPNFVHNDNDPKSIIWKSKCIYPKTLGKMTNEKWDKWQKKNRSWELWKKKNPKKTKDDPEFAKEHIYYRTIYWKILKIHNLIVKRDKEWFKDALPKLNSFWNKVLYYRKNKEEFVDFFQKNKSELEKKRRQEYFNKYRKKKNPKNNITCQFLDSSDDEEKEEKKSNDNTISQFLESSDEDNNQKKIIKKKNDPCGRALKCLDKDNKKIIYDDDEDNEESLIIL